MPVKKPRRSAFVPKLLVHTAVVGVVPACALACGGNETNPPGDASADVIHGVAAVAYPAYEAGRDQFQGVAYPAYEAGNDAPLDGGGDATGDGPTDATKADVFHGVAAVAYPAYEAGKG